MRQASSLADDLYLLIVSSALEEIASNRILETSVRYTYQWATVWEVEVRDGGKLVELIIHWKLFIYFVWPL